MDEQKEPYIEQQAVEDALYTKLQRQTLADVQRGQTTMPTTPA